MEDLDNHSILIWLDLETTGLKPRDGAILELAARATDIQGEPLPLSTPTIHRVFEHRREAIITMMDDYCLSMHLGSGLLKEVWDHHYTADTVRRRNEAQWRDIERWFARLPGLSKDHYLAGNSIHFDRRWLEQHQPALLRHVSHRMLDVSSFLIVRPEWRGTKAPAHRAEADMTASLDTYKEKILPTLLK